MVICNWREPVNADEVDLTKLMRLSKESLEFVISALSIDRETFLNGNSSEKDYLRVQARALDEAKELRQVDANLAGYKNSLRPQSGNLNPKNMGRVCNYNVITLYVWKYACWCKVKK